MNYFTSDLHLGHNVIHKYRTDKFSSQQEHDEYIFDKISKLKKREILHIIGDFIFDSDKYDYYIETMKKMNCRIKLVMGNHDSLRLYKEDRFEIQLPLYSYKGFWISHCPIHPMELRSRNGCIHGHLHQEIVKKPIYSDLESNVNDLCIKDERYFNVNLDVNNYEFILFDEIKEKFIQNKK